jgi:hypothetical protein
VCWRYFLPQPPPLGAAEIARHNQHTCEEPFEVICSDATGIFAKIRGKGLLRKVEARTREALVEAMGIAISAVSAPDARGFFEHCGYRPRVQLL